MKCSNCGWPLANDNRHCSRCGFEEDPEATVDDGVDLLVMGGLPLSPRISGLFRADGDERFVGVWRCRSLDVERQRELSGLRPGVQEAMMGPMLGLASSAIASDGILILSDRRILFFEETIVFSGLVPTDQRRYKLEYIIDLTSVVGLNDVPNGVAVLLRHDDVNLRRILLLRITRLDVASLDVAGPVTSGQAMANLRRLIDDRARRLEAEKDQEKVQVVLDFSFLRDALGKGGVVIQSAKCPNCGGMVKLPEEGASTRCEYCGSDLRAYDVLERIRALVGEIKTG